METAYFIVQKIITQIQIFASNARSHASHAAVIHYV